MSLLLSWLLLLSITGGPVLVQSASLEEVYFMTRYNLPLDPASPNITFVDPMDSLYCNRQSPFGIFGSTNIVECELATVEGAVVAPFTDTISGEPTYTYYNDVANLHLVDPCSVVYIRNSTLSSYTESAACTRSLALTDSRTNNLFGKFHYLRLDDFNATSVSAAVDLFYAKNLTASDISIYQSSINPQYNSIVDSSFGTASLNFTSQINILNTNISRLGGANTLMLRGGYESSCTISGCTIHEMTTNSMIVGRGSSMSIHNTTIDNLASGAIVLSAGSTLHIRNLVIGKANYGAIFVIEPCVFSLFNVKIGGKYVNDESALIHRIDSTAFSSIHLSEDGAVCPVKDDSASCDLSNYTEHVRVSWAKPLKTLSLSNAVHLTLVYSCASHLTAENVAGSILASNRAHCASTGNLTLLDSNFTAVHIKRAAKMEMANVFVEELMIENVTEVIWSSVEIGTVDLLSLSPSDGRHTIWDNVTINVLHEMNASSPLLIMNSHIQTLEKQLVLDHPLQRTIIDNSSFIIIHPKGIHLKRGELQLSSISLDMLLSDMIRVDEGAKLILDNVTLPSYRVDHANPRFISVDTLDQVEFRGNTSRRALTGWVAVRREEDVPSDHRFSVGPALPHCRPGNLPKLLECDFTDQSPSRVFAGALRQSHVAYLRVMGADHVTANSTCVSVLYFQDIKNLDLLEDSLECVDVLLIDSCHVSQVIENTSEVHLENITTPIVQMGVFSKDVTFVLSTIEEVFATPESFKCVHSTISSLNRVIVSQELVIENSIIDTIAQNGLVIKLGATGHINNTSISALEKHSLNVLGNLTVENTTIFFSANNSIVFFENSHVVFKNVQMADFDSNSFSYRQGAQITFTNVTINGQSHMEVFQHLLVIPEGMYEPMGDDTRHFLDQEESTPKSNWFSMEMLRKGFKNTSTAHPTPAPATTQAPAPATTQAPAITTQLSLDQEYDTTELPDEDHTNAPHQEEEPVVTDAPEESITTSIPEFTVNSATDAPSTFNTAQRNAVPAGPTTTEATPGSHTSSWLGNDSDTGPRQGSSPTRQAAATALQEEEVDDDSFPDALMALIAIAGLVAAAGLVAGAAIVVKKLSDPMPDPVTARFSGASDAVNFAAEDGLDLEHQRQLQEDAQHRPREGGDEVHIPDFVVIDTSYLPADPFYKPSIAGQYFSVN